MPQNKDNKDKDKGNLGNVYDKAAELAKKMADAAKEAISKRVETIQPNEETVDNKVEKHTVDSRFEDQRRSRYVSHDDSNVDDSHSHSDAHGNNDHNDENHDNDHNKKGMIQFSTGYHEVLIKVACPKDKKIWIHVDESMDPSCSYLDKDLFGVKDITDGFIVMASVYSNGRKVLWEVR